MNRFQPRPAARFPAKMVYDSCMTGRLGGHIRNNGHL
jgi:hypothetical protein